MNTLIMGAAAQPHACLPAYRTFYQYGSTPWHGRLAPIKQQLFSEAVRPLQANALSGQGGKQVAAADKLFSVPAMQHRAEMFERLICEAETALTSQTVRSYRRWYSYWRHRGVRVNDLLDMTWVWCQRAQAE